MAKLLLSSISIFMDIYKIQIYKAQRLEVLQCGEGSTSVRGFFLILEQKTKGIHLDSRKNVQWYSYGYPILFQMIECATHYVYLTEVAIIKILYFIYLETLYRLRTVQT